MILTLVNFRCYRGRHSFTFEDTGMTLVTGASGAGKTTLMMAMYFVITGNSPPKCITDGCDTCTVELRWKTWTLRRTKRPNRLVVETGAETLEDDLAQSFVDRHFGRHFAVTSYVPQQYQRTFLYQSPTEKLEILERLCFEDDDPEEMKKTCGLLIKDLSRRHLALKTRWQTLQEIVQSAPQSVPVEPPAPLVEEDEIRIRVQLRGIEEEEQTVRQCAALYQQLDALAAQLQTVPNGLERVNRDPEWSLLPLDQLHGRLHDQMRIHEEWEQLTARLQTLDAPWLKHTPQECAELLDNYSRDITALKEYRVAEESVQKLSTLETQFAQLDNERHRVLALNEGRYECPSCHAVLALVNQDLVLWREAWPSMTSEQKKKVLRKLDEQLESLRPQLGSLAHLRNRLRELGHLVDPNEDLHDLEEDLRWVQNYVDTERKHEHTRALLTERLAKLETMRRPDWTRDDCVQLLQVLRQVQQLQDQHAFIQRQLRERPRPDTARLSVLAADKQRHVQQLEAHAAATQAWEAYRLRRAAYDQWVAHQQEVQDLDAQVRELERRLASASELKQLMLRTESEIIDRKTAEIANLVNTYASEIFTEPITVELHTTKKTATQTDKVQIQLEVYYKNMKCDVSLLSGGEQARLNLAFILAFAHAFHSPLLLLDECTSNLDQDLTEVVMDQIGVVGIPKVILIAHQIVEGNFAQILQV